MTAEWERLTAYPWSPDVALFAAALMVAATPWICLPALPEETA